MYDNKIPSEKEKSSNHINMEWIFENAKHIYTTYRIVGIFDNEISGSMTAYTVNLFALKPKYLGNKSPVTCIAS